MGAPWVAALLVLAAAAAACSETPAATPAPLSVSSSSPGAVPSASLGSGLPSAAPGFQPPGTSEETPWGRELANLAPDGTRSKESALRLFAIAFGPLPGVERIDNGQPIGSASPAVRAVEAHWDALTAEQRSAIEAALKPPADAVVLRIDEVAKQGASADPLRVGLGGGLAVVLPPLGLTAVDPAAAWVAAIKRAAVDLRATIAARMDHDIPGPIDVIVTGPNTNAGYAHARWVGPGGTYHGCDVEITQAGVESGPVWVINSIAHEIFHCFQASGYQTPARFGSAPSWVIEGGARWVGHNITGVQTPDDSEWSTWLAAPSQSLMLRMYDAVGFWAQLDESGQSPWDVFDAVFYTGDGPSAFRATGAPDNQKFLDTWASKAARDPDRGKEWDLDPNEPGLTGAKASPLSRALANGESMELGAAPYTAELFALNVSADVLSVSAQGHGRLSDGRIDTTMFPTQFCVKGGGCPPCPDGSGPQVPPAPLGSDSLLALTGGVAGSRVQLAGSEWLPCPSPSPSPSDDDRFCRMWRAFLAWGQSHEGTDYELTREWAFEIVAQMTAMRPFAPPHLVSSVDDYIDIFGLYAAAPEHVRVPLVGEDAVAVFDAFIEIHNYCDDQPTPTLKPGSTVLHPQPTPTST